MVELNEIVNFCDKFLQIPTGQDWPNAYNGLQVQNSGSVSKIGAAVDANVLSIRRAIDEKVDLLFVHHGLFWGKSLPITGVNYELYKLLIENNLSIYSAHLPLDYHGEIGNNVSILNALDLSSVDSAITTCYNLALPIASPKSTRSRNEFRSNLKNLFSDVKAMEFGQEGIGRVIVCSGGGGGIISGLGKIDFDTVVTGEAPRHFFDFLCANNLNGYVCGHYETEVFGVRNLMQLMAEKFHLPTAWIPENCPL